MSFEEYKNLLESQAAEETITDGPFSVIVRTLLNFKFARDIYDTWFYVGLCLKTDHGTLKNLSAKIQNGVSKCEVLEILLLEWRSRRGKAATIDRLIYELEEGKQLDGPEKQQMSALSKQLQASIPTSTVPRQDLSLTKTPELSHCYDDQSTVSSVSTSWKPHHQRKKSNSSSLPAPTNEEGNTTYTPKAATSSFCLKVVKFLLKLLLLSFLLVVVITLTDFIKDLIGRYEFPAPLFTEMEESGKLLQPEIVPGIQRYSFISSTPMTSQNHCQEIQANGTNEYNSRIQEISNGAWICLTASLNHGQSWQMEDNFSGVDQVQEITLEGNFTLRAIFDMLSTFHKIKSLSITNLGNDSCSDALLLGSSPISQSRSRKHLNQISSLVFNNIGNCVTLFEFIELNFKINTLSSIKVSNSIIMQESTKGIQGLLKSNRYSLKTINFPNTVWDSPIFVNFLCLFHTAVEFEMDFLTSKDHQIELLDHKFHDYMPNLRKFISHAGYLPMHHLASMVKLRSLETLHLSLSIPKGGKLDVDDLKESFLSMKDAKIALNFTDPSDCTIIRRENGKSLKPFVLTTNCHTQSRENLALKVK